MYINNYYARARNPNSENPIMAGALNRIDSLRYMSDYENRLRRFKSNLQHIFEKVSTLWSEMVLWIGAKILMFYRFR